MGMGVDEGGHDDAAPGIDDLGIGVLAAEGSLLAHLHDSGALEGNGTVFIIALTLAVAGNKPSVRNQIHSGNLLHSKIQFS